MTALDGVPRIGADELAALVTPSDAFAAIERALCAGLDPEAEQPRAVADVAAGQLLLMPADGIGFTGVKVATVAPGNPALGLPRIGALYVLFDAVTLQPVALLDGTALTSLRTPAVSAVAVSHLASRAAGDAVVFGTGPQAWGHIEALHAAGTLASATVVGRDPGRVEALVDRCVMAGIPAGPGSAADVAGADLVCCCTSARTPLFDGALVADHAVVVAVGSHEPEARELDGGLLTRAGAVVVESRATALREAGDLLVPLHEGRFGAERITGNIADLVTGRLRLPADGPRVFKSVGMGWQDLVVAAEAYRRVAEALSV